MTEPTSIYAGDTVSWTKSLSSYPSTLWTLNYALTKDGGSIDIAGTPQGTDHLMEVPADTTATWLPGVYNWTAYVSDGTNRYTIEFGEIRINANPAAGGYDARSTARIMLDNVEAYLLNPANLAAASYSIGGRSLSRWSRSELLVERDKLLAEVRSEESANRIARGLGNPRRLYVRFDRP